MVRAPAKPIKVKPVDQILSRKQLAELTRHGYAVVLNSSITRYGTEAAVDRAKMKDMTADQIGMATEAIKHQLENQIRQALPSQIFDTRYSSGPWGDLLNVGIWVMVPCRDPNTNYN
jgi:formate-dependent phosphoribosylglycinamide formyltransferase (GAR transformylase)